MAEMENDVYSTIANIVSAAAPDNWKEIIVTASIEDDSGEVIYDYINSHGEMNWFVLESEDDHQTYLTFRQLRLSMKAIGQLWHTARYFLENSGSFRVEFEYEIE